MMNWIKKLVLGVAAVGLMMSFSVPAMAQPLDPCSPMLQQGNAMPTGDLQYADPNADVSGGDLQIEPTATTTCEQTIPQTQGGGGISDEIDYGNWGGQVQRKLSIEYGTPA